MVAGHDILEVTSCMASRGGRSCDGSGGGGGEW